MIDSSASNTISKITKILDRFRRKETQQGFSLISRKPMSKSTEMEYWNN